MRNAILAVVLLGAGHAWAGKTKGPVILDCAPAKCAVYADAKDAFLDVVKDRPSILGIGEYHQTTHDVKADFSIKRFTRDLFPLVVKRSSDLIVETWLADGHCGEEEKKVVATIRTETERPPETEDEVVTLVKYAKKVNVTPHVLRLSCDEYKGLQDKAGELDNEKLLVLVASKLSEKASNLSTQNRMFDRQKAVLIYGGALHNDLAPDPDLAELCFGPQLAEKTKGAYSELDLIVPEFIAADDDLRKETWWPLVEKNKGTTRTLLVRPADRRFFVIFPWSAK